jgi:KipI family sensor histidine kinase inhibitor
VRFLPAGRSALLVELDGIEEVLALASEVQRRREHGWEEALTDVVPGARTLLLDGLRRPHEAAAEIAGWVLRPSAPTAGATVELRCRYGGPDLAEVARSWGVNEEEVAAIHTSLAHRVAFCGFAPGFAYIAGLGERWQVRRRPAPRAAVPAGSVALAGTYTGVYPRSSPGGWQLIGHTDEILWDLSRRPPALLSPGTTVRFLAA